MAKPFAIRRGWMKFMYLYTILTAGGLGLGIVIMPQVVKEALRWPANEPIALGIVGSVCVASALLCVLGLRDPLKFAPVLLLQLCYKSVWFLGVVLPLLIGGRFPAYGILTAGVFATYIVGDLIAIPFRYLLSPASGTEAAATPRGAS